MADSPTLVHRPKPEEAWSDEVLREKVGQLFIVGFHGHTPSSDIKNLIQTHKVGAIILFGRNVQDAAQLLTLTNSLQEIAKESGYKQGLLIAIDQENGLVTRIKAPTAAQLPGSMALGATGDSKNAYEIAKATAETLRAFGINMNYAPIGDINSEPKNPVIGVRSPSDDPETVGRFVSSQIKGLEEGGVVACVKHFPGHGDTAVDSHFGLPRIEKSRVELEGCELVPFRRAVAEGVEAVMTAHIELPGISRSETTEGLPASLSEDAIAVLRREMGYEGLIVSDCLEMDGVRATFGTENGAVMALRAGTDCVMICHTMSAQVGAIEKVIQAVKSGELQQSSIEASVARLEKIKSKYAPNPTTVSTATLDNLEARNTRQAKLASEIYAKSTTVVRSEKDILPISSDPSKKVVFLSPGKPPLGGGAVDSGEERTREFYTTTAFSDLLKAHNANLIDIRFHDGGSLSPEQETDIDEADIIIFASRNASLSPFQKDLGLSLGKRLGGKLIVIATCDPYDFLEESEEIRNYVAIYEPTIPAFKSAVDVIFGIAIAQGTLPVGTNSKQHEIITFSGTYSEISHIWYLWQEIFPKWPITRQRLSKILKQEHGRHYIHEKGFCISFLMEGPWDSKHGCLSVLGVLPEYRKKGLGTALLTTARKGLMEKNGGKQLNSCFIGSVFPRIWPQVPITFPQEDKDFFLHRGFRKSNEPTARDLFRDITGEVAPQKTLDRVAKLQYKFMPWTAEMYEECMTKQNKNFQNIGWVEAYARLAAANQHHEVMVALDSVTNSQIGWTLMCSHTSVISDDFAFLPLMPSGDKTGLIACVGVNESARGKGVGLALLVKAMEDMRRRGVKGVCIDWVVIRGFYETLGFEPEWEYEGYSW